MATFGGDVDIGKCWVFTMSAMTLRCWSLVLHPMPLYNSQEMEGQSQHRPTTQSIEPKWGWVIGFTRFTYDKMLPYCVTIIILDHRGLEDPPCCSLLQWMSRPCFPTCVHAISQWYFTHLPWTYSIRFPSRTSMVWKYLNHHEYWRFPRSGGFRGFLTWN